jgi:hypothetical protein
VDEAALVSSVAALLGVIVYLYLGWRLGQRPTTPATRLPALQFALFWVVLGSVSAISGIESLVAVFQVPALDLVVSLLYLEILLLCFLLWALVSYLLFLFTGHGYALPLAGLYAVLYVLLLYYITASVPDAVTVTFGAVGTTDASTVTGPIVGVLLIILVAPEFIGAISYFTLFFRTNDPTIRYRVALVSWSLIGWFGLSFSGAGSALGGTLLGDLIGRSLGLLAAGVILLAYYPPKAIRQRFGVRGLDPPSGVASG